MQNSKYSCEYVKNFIESEGYQLLSDTYKNTRTKLLLKCPIGHEYKATFGNFKNRNSRCPVCSKKQKYTYEHVKNFIESHDYTLISTNYKNANANLLLKCPIGHEYKTTFSTFKNGHRCKICMNKLNKQSLSYKTVNDYIKSQGYQLLSNSYKNNITKLLLKCPIGHDYKVTFNAFKNGNRCPICNDNKTSKGEQDLALYVESLGISIIRNDRNTIINPLTNRNLELDIYIPSLNKAIEYNGVYWHSFLDKQKNDNIKKDQCKQLGIDLLIVNEKNWLTNQEVEQNIIRNFINV